MGYLLIWFSCHLESGSFRTISTLFRPRRSPLVVVSYPHPHVHPQSHPPLWPEICISCLFKLFVPGLIFTNHDSDKTVRDWNELHATPLSSVECTEACVTRFTSLVRSRGWSSQLWVLVKDFHWTSPPNNSDSDSDIDVSLLVSARSSLKRRRTVTIYNCQFVIHSVPRQIWLECEYSGNGMFVWLADLIPTGCFAPEDLNCFWNVRYIIPCLFWGDHDR